MFGNVSAIEILIVLIIALIVFGPKRLPELGSSLGRGIREFRGALGGDGADEDGNAERPPATAPREIEPAEDEPAADRRP
jgi:sec-independent protein translocase protein TatA